MYPIQCKRFFYMILSYNRHYNAYKELFLMMNLLDPTIQREPRTHLTSQLQVAYHNINTAYFSRKIENESCSSERLRISWPLASSNYAKDGHHPNPLEWTHFAAVKQAGAKDLLQANYNQYCLSVRLNRIFSGVDTVRSGIFSGRSCSRLARPKKVFSKT
ncbi:hypothetical protein HA402_013549 [Bradysia odoriphaga]|nr:hypothetical protein HA402_013549 [Bradysia odoriphaga]